MAFTKRAVELFRDDQQPGNPLSGRHDPLKPDIRVWGKEIEDQLEAVLASAGIDPTIINDLAKGRLLANVMQFDRDLQIDLIGGLNGAPRVFIPLAFRLRAGSGVTFDGNLQNEPAPDRLGYTAFNLPAAGTRSQIVFNPATNRVEIYVEPNTPTAALASFLTVITLWNRTWSSPFPVEAANDPVPNFHGPLAIDGASTLCIPYLTLANTPADAPGYGPSDGSLYREIALNTDLLNGAAGLHVYYDTVAAARGLDPLGAAFFPSKNFWAPPGCITLYRNHKGQTTTPVPLAQVLKNDFPNGAGSINPPILYLDTTQVAMTDPAITALGFAVGYGSAGGSPFYGGYLTQRRQSGFVFVRIYVEFAQAAQLSSPVQCFAVDPDSSTNTLIGNLRLEKKLSARSAMFIGVFSLAGFAVPRAIIAGTFAIGAKVTGEQYAIGDSSNIWISRSDYEPIGTGKGSAVSLLMNGLDPSAALVPGHLFFVQGRRQALYPPQLITSVAEGLRYRASLELYGSDADPLVIHEGPTWNVAADAPFTTGRVVMRDLTGNPGRWHTKGVAVHTAAPRTAGAVNVLVIGDSISNRQTVAAVRAKLARIGLVPNFIGTMNAAISIANAGDATGPVAECREGRAFGDHIYAETGQSGPLAPGQEATYLASAKSAKLATNPFIRAATGSDPAQNIRNGYVFDFGFYLTRFSLPAPDMVIIALGTNDEDRYPANAQTYITDGMRIMHQSIRAAAPNARIGLMMYARARQQDADGNWVYARTRSIQNLILYVRTAADAALFDLAGWLGMSRNAGFPSDGSLVVDGYTAMLTGKVTDPTHPNVVGLNQIAEQMAAFAAALTTNLLTSPFDVTAAAWTKTNLTPANSTTLGPDGVNQAPLLLDTAASGPHSFSQAANVTPGSKARFAIALKPGGRSRAIVRLADPNENIAAQMAIDFSAGTITSAASTYGGATAARGYLIPLGNGWYGVALEAVVGASGSVQGKVYLADDAGASPYAGDITKGVYATGGALIVV